MSKKKKKRKSKKIKNQKSKTSFLSFLKNYIAVISFFVSGIGLFLNIAILYFQKAKETQFEINYYIQKIDLYPKESSGNNDKVRLHMSYPTYNNEINQFLHKYREKLTDYYIVYLVLEQVKIKEAREILLTLEKRGEIAIEEFDINQLEIDRSKTKTETISLQGIFHQGEGIKIPVAICEFDDNTMIKKECILEEINPIKISFKNKYLFSNQTQKIREMYLNLVLFEGEIINGRGGVPDDSKKEWYER